jgi:hypothetical protein
MRKPITTLLFCLLVATGAGPRAKPPPQLECDPGYVAVCVPEGTPTAMPTPTRTRTPTGMPTATRTPTRTPTAAPTPSPVPPGDADFTLTPTSLAYPSTQVGATSPAQSVRVDTVTGGYALTVNVIGTYQLTQTCMANASWNGILAPNSGCDIKAVFEPTVAGSAPGTITVDALGTRRTASLSGTGTTVGPLPTPAPTGVPTVAPTAAPPTPTRTATVVPTAGPPSAVATPIPPQKQVDTTLPTPSGTVRQVAAGGNLQAALDAAVPGDVIELAQGATFTGRFMFKKKTGSAPIWLRSSGWQTLPPQGTRVKPADAPKMARLINPSGYGEGPILFELGASNYYFTGLEIASSNTATSWTHYSIVTLGLNPADSGAATSLDQLPDNVIFDRVYIHGSPTGNVRRGITANTRALGVVDSWIDEIHELGADNQAISGWNAAGPVLLKNNYISASCENTMWGGSPASILNLTPSDITIVGNHYFKPIKWKNDDPAYAGIGWSIKNLIEWKHAQRVLIEGNIFERWWVSGQTSVAPITPRADGGNSWATTRDMDWRNNVFKENYTGTAVFNTMGYDAKPSLQTVRLRFVDNLIDSTGAGLAAWQILGGVDSIIMEHNTFLLAEGKGSPLSLDKGGGPNVNLVYRNNIVQMGNYGICASGLGCGNNALAQAAPGIDLRGNLIYGPYPTPGGSNPSSLSNYPGNFYPANRAAVGIDPVTHKLLPTSQWKGKGWNGADPGILTPK